MRIKCWPTHRKKFKAYLNPMGGPAWHYDQNEQNLFDYSITSFNPELFNIPNWECPDTL